MKQTEEKVKGGRKRTHLVKVYLSDDEYEKLCRDAEMFKRDKSSGHRKQKIEIYYNAVGIIDLPTIKEDDCIALHGRCKGKKIAV